MQQKVAKPGENVITQGEKGDNFYIVEDGTFDILVNGVGKVAVRGPGDSFGEKALLYNCPRSATVCATSVASLWALDRVAFRYLNTLQRVATVCSLSHTPTMHHTLPAL